MRCFLLILSALLPVVSLGDNVTQLVRLPIFCNVAGKYEGKHTNGTWIASLDPYTGIASLSIQDNGHQIFGTGSIKKLENRTVFMFDAPDNRAWRGIFTVNKNNAMLSGSTLSFDAKGSFSASRTQSLAICSNSPAHQ